MSHFSSYPCSKPASDFPYHLTEGFLPGWPESGPTWLNLLAFSSHPTLLAAPSISRLVSTLGPLHFLLSSLFFPCTCAQLILSLSHSVFAPMSPSQPGLPGPRYSHCTPSTHPGFPLCITLHLDVVEIY